MITMSHIFGAYLSSASKHQCFILRSAIAFAHSLPELNCIPGQVSACSVLRSEKLHNFGQLPIKLEID